MNDKVKFLEKLNGLREMAKEQGSQITIDEVKAYFLEDALTEEQTWELSFSDGSKYTWMGSVSVSANEGTVDAVLEMTISVTPSTVPVWSKGD